MRKLAVLIILAVLLSACSAAAKTTDPLVAIETSPGKDFRLVIETNPTTGYHWEIVGELDQKIVQFVSRDYQPENTQTVGSGGVEIWAFKAVGPGETQITLGYYPPSNEPSDPQQTEIFSVKVK